MLKMVYVSKDTYFVKYMTKKNRAENAFHKSFDCSQKNLLHTRILYFVVFFGASAFFYFFFILVAFLF